jgi:hypothetical protein
MGAIVRAEELLGRELLTPGGRPIGRIEELEIGPRDGDPGDYVVRAVIVGPLALLARLGMYADDVPVLRWFGCGRDQEYRSFRWEWLDLSDPKHPRLVAGRD